MAVLKAQCPECDAKLRLSVDGEGDHDVECPKCGHAFTATLEGDDPPAKAEKPKKADKAEKADKGTKEKATAKADKSGTKKAAKRRDEDEEDEDEEDTPKKKKKKGAPAEADGSKSKLLVAGIVAGVLIVAGLGGVIYAVTSKDKTAKKSDTPADVNPPAQPGPAPGVNPPIQPGPGPAPGPGPGPNTNPNPGPKPPIVPGPGPGPGPNPGPKPKDPDDEGELSTSLPPPPKIKFSGSVVPTDKPVVRAPAAPPLAPDEDPFVRAKDFKLEGPLPTLPKLAERGQRPLLTLEAGGHTDMIGKVFFTPKGDRVITIARDKAVRIWDPATNETAKTIRFPAGPGKEGSLQAAALARTGKQLAVAGYPVGTVPAGKGPIYLVSPETGALIKTLAVASAPVWCLHFSNDGKWLGVGCENGAIQMVDVTNGVGYVAPGSIDGPPILEVKFNPNLNQKFKKLAILDADRTVNLWTFSTPPQRKEFGIRSAGRPTTLAWSNDGRTLAVGTTKGDIMLGTEDGQLIKSLAKLTHNGKPVSISQLQFLPGNNEIAVVGVDGQAGGVGSLINADTGAVRVMFKEHTNVVFALDVSPDGQQIVTSGGSQHESYIWSADDGKVLHRFVGSGNGVWAVGWAKDGKSLAWGTSNRPVAGSTELPLEHTFRLDEFGVGNPPDPSKYTQTITSDEHVKLTVKSPLFLVQTTGREPEPMLLNEGEKIYAATVLPKGNAVAVAGVESLALVNPATAREVHKFIGHTGNVLCVTPSPDGKLFATGSSDQTIRIWHRDREEPLLSIFVAGRDWIAWTPQGYYACSGQGERLVAWQVGIGTNKVPVVHPAERFRASMYQPAMLKYLVPAGDLPRAMAMAQKFDKALVQTTSVADVLPPEVTLDGFETEIKAEKDTITVKASAKSAKHPIVAMRLLVNGRPFQGTAGVKKFDNLQAGVDATATWEVPLSPGSYTFAVIADSPVSKGMSKVGLAVRPGEIPKPNLYVLAMGVSEYPGKSKLNYCATDAEMLAKAFQEKSKAVFNKIEVKVLTDKAATKKGILEGMDWLKSKMTPQDVGIVSFSGHGMRDPFGQFYLVPIDFDPRDEDCTTALSGKLFKERLDNMPGRLVAILDACHSGTVAEKERPPAQADTLVRDLTAEDSGVVVMCASAGREYATESKLTKAGFYTLGLVEGLSGHADIDGDGVVYIHELDIYATARVRQLSGGRQNPTLGRPTSVRPFIIAKVDKPIAP